MAVTVVARQRRVRVSAPRLRRAAARALTAAGRAGAGLEVLVVDDADIRRLNARFRGVPRRTDVLAFPMETADAATGLVGQLVVSAETARRQSRRLGVPVEAELALLVTHGVLHLIGYDDRDPVEARLMHERERQILAAGSPPPPDRLWTGLLAQRSRVASLSGHPRLAPASRTPLQWSRVASLSGHPRPAPASRTPFQS